MAEVEKQTEGAKKLSLTSSVVILVLIVSGVYWIMNRGKNTDNIVNEEVKTEAPATIATEMDPLPGERSTKILASGLQIDSSLIKVIGTEEKQWPDGCLGLGKADESCAQVMTPGYEVKLEAQGVIYTYHTDALVNQIRAVK